MGERARAGRLAPVFEALEDRRLLTAPGWYDTGSPALVDLWVDPLNGNDNNPGTSPSAPLRTLYAAWADVTDLADTGYRINLLPGTYPFDQDHFNYLDGLQATYTHPVIIQATSGPGTATIQGGLNIANVSYLYLIDLNLVDAPNSDRWGNNVLHVAQGDHILLRGLTVSGPSHSALPDNYDIQEDIKVNQSSNVFMEGCNVSGTYQTGVDFFSVQYGHILACIISDTGGWGAYLKGGSAYFLVEGNTIHDTGLGFQAGEGSTFEVMREPWINYEAYDIKFVDNVLYNVAGTGLSVSGGYDILLAYNTLYDVATYSDAASGGALGYALMTFVLGARDDQPTDEIPNPLPVCQQYVADGGWGPVNPGEAGEWIPNRNVYVFNNLFDNPAPAQTRYDDIEVADPATPPADTGIPSPARADDGLLIQGNVIWNGPPGFPLGIADPGGMIAAQNAINTIAPQLMDPADGDFRPVPGSSLTGVAASAIPDFTWSDAPARPAVPVGTLSNAVPIDHNGNARGAGGVPGAFNPPLAPGPSAPVLSPMDDTGASHSDGVTRNNGSVAAPLTFTIGGVSPLNGFVQLEIVSNAGVTPLGNAVQASNGTATIVLAGTPLPDGTYQIAATDAPTMGGTPSALSPAASLSIQTRLTVIATSPADGLAVPSVPGGQVVVTFNHWLVGLTPDVADGSSFAGSPFAVMLIPSGPDGLATQARTGVYWSAPSGIDSGDLPVPSTLVYHQNPDGTSTIALTPNQPLSTDIYLISIGGLTDLAGNPLADAGGHPGAVFASFDDRPPNTAASPLEVTAVTANDGAVIIDNDSIPQPDTIGIRFNKPLSAFTVNSSTFQLLAQHGSEYTPVASAVAYSPTTDTAYLTPELALVPGTVYVVAVSGSVSDDQNFPNHGMTLGQPFYTSFSVSGAGAGAGTSPLNVVQTNPRNGVVWTAPLGYGAVTFSEPISLSSLGRFSAMLVSQTGGLTTGRSGYADVPLNAKLTFNPNTNQLIIVPTGTLRNDTVYLFALSAIQAANGDSLTGTTYATFRLSTSSLTHALAPSSPSRPPREESATVVAATPMTHGGATTAPSTRARRPMPGLLRSGSVDFLHRVAQPMREDHHARRTPSQALNSWNSASPGKSRGLG